MEERRKELVAPLELLVRGGIMLNLVKDELEVPGMIDVFEEPGQVFYHFMPRALEHELLVRFHHFDPKIFFPLDVNEEHIHLMLNINYEGLGMASQFPYPTTCSLVSSILWYKNRHLIEHEGYAVSQTPIVSIDLKEYQESGKAFWKGKKLANALAV